MEESGKWQPAVGTYKPRIEAIMTNENDKLLPMARIPDKNAQLKVTNVRKSQTMFCQRLEKQLVKNSIFQVYKNRKKQVQIEQMSLDLKKEELKKQTAKLTVGKGFEKLIVTNMLKKEMQ